MGKAKEKKEPEASTPIYPISGIYMSETSHHLRYYVDTIIKKCYVVFYTPNGSGIDTIPCKDLKLRPEWEKIITW